MSLPPVPKALRSPSLIVGLFLMLPLTAGCIGADVDSGSGETEETIEVVLDNALEAINAGEPAANVHRLGAFTEPAQEIDAWGDFLAVMQNPKLRILNVSDPADPVLVGELTLKGVKDVKWSNDGQYVFIGDDGGLTGPPAHPESSAGFYVIDVSDKADPKLLSHLPAEGRRGPHMVFYHETSDGRELVMGASADISINEFDRETGALTELARYSPDIVTDWNRAPHVVDPLYQGWAHDMFAMEDPVENKTIMYVANWDAGLRIVDLSDPAAPTELGKWDDYPQDHSGNLHTVSTAWVGDRRITVGSPELGFQVVGGYHYYQGTEKNGVYVWDTTDPTDVKMLTYWSHPVERCTYAERGADQPYATMGESITSSHNLQFEGGRVYMAHYACGIVVLDLASGHGGTLESPKLLAYDMDVDSTWDVILHEGAMFLGDSAGVLVDHFVADELGPDGISSRA